MQFGVTIFATDFSLRPDHLAKLVEDRGFESLWFPEHTHIPASRVSSWPGGASLPEEYWHTYDPFVALTAAAMVTTNLKIGTGICLVVERDPITTAKEVASLDTLSNGRFMFGIGGGWNAEEMANHGTPFKTRWRLLRERVLSMKEIWMSEEPEFHGNFVDFDKLWSYPKPIQKPHPPILMGGDGLGTLDRVVEFCDGWMPIFRGAEAEGKLPDRMIELHQLAKRAGRTPESISVSIFGGVTNRESIARLEQLGVTRIIFRLPSSGREEVLPLLDKYAELAR